VYYSLTIKYKPECIIPDIRCMIYLYTSTTIFLYISWYWPTSKKNLSIVKLRDWPPRVRERRQSVRTIITMSVIVAGIRQRCRRKHVWMSAGLLQAHALVHRALNPLNGTLKPHSNGPLYSNTVIGTLAVDGWAVTFGTARSGLGGLGPRPVPSSLYQM